MSKCETCKHWDEFDPANDDEGSIGFGTCKNARAPVHGIVYGLMMYLHEPDGDAALMTRGEFYCSQWDDSAT